MTTWLQIGGNVSGLDGITRAILNQFLDHIGFETIADKWVEFLVYSDFDELVNSKVGAVVYQKIDLEKDVREFIESDTVRKDLWNQVILASGPYSPDFHYCLFSVIGKQIKTAKKWPALKKEILSRRKELRRAADVIEG